MGSTLTDTSTIRNRIIPLFVLLLDLVRQQRSWCGRTNDLLGLHVGYRRQRQRRTLEKRSSHDNLKPDVQLPIAMRMSAKLCGFLRRCCYVTLKTTETWVAMRTKVVLAVDEASRVHHRVQCALDLP